MILPSNTGLLIVDVQRAIDDPSWAADRPRNNPGAEANIAALLANWRQLGFPIFHVKHDGTFPTSTYRPGQPPTTSSPKRLRCRGRRSLPRTPTAPSLVPN
jgi:nicotinamidase-related amidase